VKRGIGWCHSGLSKQKGREDGKPRGCPVYAKSRRKGIIPLHERIVGVIVSRVQTGTPGDLHGSGTPVLISIPLPSRSLSLSKDGLGYQSLKLKFIFSLLFFHPLHSAKNTRPSRGNGRQAGRAGQIQGRTLVALRRRDMRLESIVQNTRR